MTYQPEVVRRWFAASGVVGAALALLNAPLATLASVAAYQDGLGRPPPSRPRLLEPLLAFDTPADVYEAYGRLWVPIVLLFLLGAAALYLHFEPVMDAALRRPFSILLPGLLMLIPGNFGDYWLGRDLLGPTVWGLNFMVFTVFGLLVTIVGSTWLGVVLFRGELAPRWVAIPFAAAPLGFLIVPLVPNAPAAQFLVFAFAWLVSGVFVLRSPAPVAAPTPAETVNP